MTEIDTTPTTSEAPAPTGLAAHLPAERLEDPDEILDRFLGWVAELGFDLYPAQEEALLEIMAGRHVILNTPTGSGKSLVALGMHFKAMCEEGRSFYTSPIKALASEKFFSLCNDLGAENVGMQTGDASINAEASVICCTAEVLANRALRQGPGLSADYVVMDEFHYYADPERGVAWQVPLIGLPETTFLLMSATLGNTTAIADKIEQRTGRKVALVYSEDRPVPLDYEYRETSLHETVQELLVTDRAPIYIVSFTQRDCAELAQSLTSMQVASREERKRIAEAFSGVRFDTPYGKELRRFLSFGVAVHHAGLLPKYRLLVEQLAQQGLLKIICGTDTLGVGVNIPLRTVLFTQLAKYDGRKTAILKVRDFKQIAGRAGRRGFDDRGSVVAQAPEHVIANRRAAKKPQRKKKPKKRPADGQVSWSKDTFERLIARPPETLKSRFQLSHGMVLNLLQRDAELDLTHLGNFDSLREIIEQSHEEPGKKRKLLSEAALLVRSLYRSGIIKMARDTKTAYMWAVVNEDLQWDFSLFQVLSLYLVETLELLDADSETYALDVVSLVEAILEDPMVILRRQVDKAKGDLIALLKAEGVPYEERMERLEEVTYPMPNGEWIENTFDAFRQRHPWVRGAYVRPKSIGREIFEGYFSFHDYVRHYGLQRSEGVFLRYLSQLYKTLSQSVPERDQSEGVHDIVGFFRTMIEQVDTSLLEEWESMLHPEISLQGEEEREKSRRELRIYELFHDPKAFQSRVRAELHQIVRWLAEQNYSAAFACLRPDPEDPAGPWSEERLEEAMQPYFAEYGELLFNHEARHTQHSRIAQTASMQWEVSQVLVDPEGDCLWHLAGSIDLSGGQSLDGPLFRLHRIGT